MSIALLKKATLCGLVKDKPRILEDLRDLGCLHLLPPQGTTSDGGDVVEQPEDIVKALRYLRDCPRKRRRVGKAIGFDAADVASLVLRNQAKKREQSDRRDFLQHRIKELAPWGTLLLPGEFGELGLKFWFYIVPAGFQHRLRNDELIWQVVHRERGYLYIVVIAEREPSPHAMPVPRTRTGSVPLAELEAELDAVNLTLEDLEAERESLTRWIDLLEAALAAVEDVAALRRAMRSTYDAAPLFILQAWVPGHEVDRVEAYCEARGLALQMAVPDPGDRPPTLLVNAPMLEAGQSLVSFYQLPPYGSWDPSAPVLFSFALFFAIILSDAGYGAVLGVCVPLFWRSFGASPSGVRMRRLVVLIAGVSVIWGMLVGSYFGWSPPSQSWLGQMRILSVADFDAMMRLTLLLGVLHLGGANLARAWQSRRSGAAWAPLGWIAVMAGGYLWWSADGAGRFGTFARWLLIGGIALVLSFAKQMPVRRMSDLLRRLLAGLLEIAGNLSKLFGDVLSYLRLFALGLAGSSLAETFNGLAHSASRTLAGAGLFASVLILLVGHSLNFLLGLMSGVVHGLRLNFIEFYSWGLKGEGHPFRPFRKKEIPR
ncbi:V-type ATP synthase subunit I [Methylococcus sp. Mc7]|uniref:V-type ATP synthase subunit I n=1 Tax=Methylococcus sp. Mc7 TaxID=2860258 RepID=UPI001C530D74|nr:ATPase [Methylococcus sp. Mc7]QXP83358.1 ATPase [Methylococcus sp. Mc7]